MNSIEKSFNDKLPFLLPEGGTFVNKTRKPSSHAVPLLPNGVKTLAINWQ